MNEFKTCSKCKTEKPISDFYPTTVNGKLRIHSECKPCFNYRIGQLHKTPEYKKKVLLYNNKWRRKHNLEILRHYGNKCGCLPCGFDDFEKKVQGKRFLELDHINGGGAKEVRKYNANNFKIIEKLNYPTDRRVLCRACNNSMEPGESICEYHKWQINTHQIQWSNP